MPLQNGIWKLNEHNLMSATGNSASNLERTQNKKKKKKRAAKVKGIIPCGSEQGNQGEKNYTKMHSERIKDRQAQCQAQARHYIMDFLSWFRFTCVMVLSL